MSPRSATELILSAYYVLAGVNSTNSCTLNRVSNTPLSRHQLRESVIGNRIGTLANGTPNSAKEI
jgi:hypothetical protein